MAQRIYTRLNSPHRENANDDNHHSRTNQQNNSRDDANESSIVFVSKKNHSSLVHLILMLLVTITLVAFFVVYRQPAHFITSVTEIPIQVHQRVDLPRKEEQKSSSSASSPDSKYSESQQSSHPIASLSSNTTTTTTTTAQQRNRESRKQPYWMDKHPSLPDQTDVPPKNRICFVHVGKTAGSSLACYLGFMYDCGLSPDIPDGNLPKYTTNIMHTKYDNCQGLEFSYYLYVVREPLSRIQSWWTYERPKSGRRSSRWELKKPLFIDCGWYSLNDMAGSTGLASTIPTECSQRAWSAIRGEVGYSVHNSYNFQKYFSQIPEGSKLIVLRTEHLQEDYNKAELLVGGKPLAKPFPRKNKSVKEDADKILSDRSRELLCEGLCQEIQTYKRILKTAVNLDEQDYQVSLAELMKTCPKQARANQCE
jgi:hypothetical protein